ncbi:type IV pilin protein [Aeromonas media]|uniref:type IV pilin protein n=1 Tax=Aeromonas media TaxID=651 RepID=UPI0038CFEDB4
MKTKQSGITLLELMVVVAVVAILAAIAYPSFADGLRKSRRAEAVKGLLSMQLKQEEYRISNPSYSNVKSQVGDPASDYYTFSISGANATTYTLIATAPSNSSQASDKVGSTDCNVLKLDKADIKWPDVCWK